MINCRFGNILDTVWYCVNRYHILCARTIIANVAVFTEMNYCEINRNIGVWSPTPGLKHFRRKKHRLRLIELGGGLCGNKRFSFWTDHESYNKTIPRSQSATGDHLLYDNVCTMLATAICLHTVGFGLSGRPRVMWRKYRSVVNQCWGGHVILNYY